ncbi:MAG: hypothetical protein Q8Q09_12955 [Deltaproteobacteria bacterium]|nr:hypothetical protein [Deltaproteobacteria bacterium]
MDGLSEEELGSLDVRFPSGIASHEIIEFFEKHGLKFSEATLRKYVQLGLLPRSVRVGMKGKNRGSQGLYPISIVPQILEIKRLLQENKSIDEIRGEYFLLRSDIESVDQTTQRLFERVDAAVLGKTNDAVAEVMKRDLRAAREAAATLLERLRSIETRLSTRADLARAAAKIA